jgi:hypothetical protein
MSESIVMEPIFPVLCLSQDGSILVTETPDRLGRCNALAFFKNRYYEGLLLIDSEADRFRVVRAELVPTPSIVSRLVTRVLNRRLEVRVQMEPEGVGTLDDAKGIVNAWLDRSPDFWEASRDIEEWREMIGRAGTARALIALFS